MAYGLARSVLGHRVVTTNQEGDTNTKRREGTDQSMTGKKLVLI